jgi:anti-sigma B factor antagonist
MSLEERVPELGSQPSLQDSRLPAPIEVSVSWIKDTALMVVVGEVDASSAAHLRQIFEEISLEVRGDVILDLGLVWFMDSTGLSFLVAAHKQLKSQGARLVVFSPTPQVRRIFQITGLMQVLTIEPFEQG